ncbi:MAG: acetyl-CoA carboxylase biotin carboxyl carrier protein [Acidobacteriota bacterium]|jgi:acetyl-CoA carboxylase biotin carboxyl carrier protein|nr:acetyl-CoA carboxylase biotin carboxyl carrier protein [Acidobacteriota bacterium]
MSTSDQNQPRPDVGDAGTGTAAAPQQAETPGAERGARHGRGRRGRAGGRNEQGRPPQPQGHTSRRADSTLNMDELRELTELFTAHGLTDFEFENADIRIRLSRNPAPAAGSAQAVVPTPAPGPQAALHSAASLGVPPAASAANEGTAAAAETPEEELHVITSPIVGTFYRSPSPQADSFVKVGSQVEQDSVVCIIEAMKLMNEIQAETTGTVAKIYVENGQPVEYGQPLFGVKK